MKHRGRIQPQGGGTEKSVAWSRDSPPTESEMLQFCDELEAQLTEDESRDRSQPMALLRNLIRRVAALGGVSAPFNRSWRKRGSKDIRIDLEVKTGQACVPD